MSPYLPPSRMTSVQLLALSDAQPRHHVWCTLFPTKGPPIQVRVGIHPFFEQKPSPLDLTVETYLESTVLHSAGPHNISDYTALVQRYAPGHYNSLSTYYAVYSAHDETVFIPRNQRLEQLIHQSVIRGNVLVAEYDANFHVRDICTDSLGRYELLAAGLLSQYVGQSCYQVTAKTIEFHGISWNPPAPPLQRPPQRSSGVRALFMPELCDLMLHHLPTLLLPVFAALSAFHRYRTQCHTRERIAYALSKHVTADEFPGFLAHMHHTRSLIVGGLVRRLLLDDTSATDCMDIIVPSAHYHHLKHRIEGMGYTQISLIRPRSWTVAGTGQIVLLYRNSVRIKLIESKDVSPFTTLLRSGNTLQFNAISNTMIYSFYPRHLQRREGFRLHKDKLFNQNNPDVVLRRTNAFSARPCLLYCPQAHRKTYHDTAAFKFHWHGNYEVQGSPSIELPLDAHTLTDPRSVPTTDTWESNDLVTAWTLFHACWNQHCVNFDQPHDVGTNPIGTSTHWNRADGTHSDSGESEIMESSTSPSPSSSMSN